MQARQQEQFEKITERLEQSAVIQERMLGRLDDHDRRLKLLEGGPQDARSIISTYGGCVGQTVFALFSFCGLCLSVASFIIVLTR